MTRSRAHHRHASTVVKLTEGVTRSNLHVVDVDCMAWNVCSRPEKAIRRNNLVPGLNRHRLRRRTPGWLLKLLIEPMTSGSVARCVLEPRG
jgi:hypothetical protein